MSRIDSSFEAEDPKQIRMTCKITATMEDWCVIRKMLQDGQIGVDGNSEAGPTVIGIIDELVEEAKQHFYATADGPRQEVDPAANAVDQRWVDPTRPLG